MNCFSEEQLNRISHLVREIEKLSDAEKLYLYLQLPCGRVEGKSKYDGQSKADPAHKKTDQETTQTYTWILSHLESDPNVSLPKQEVYDEYRAFCQSKRFEPMCVADFGKAMKHAFPSIKPRRLGQRGNSRYCYSGLRKKYRIQPPTLPDTIDPSFCLNDNYSQAYNQVTVADCLDDNPNEYSIQTRTGNTRPYEVMNLKIEPNSPRNHHQHQQQYNITIADGHHLKHSTAQTIQNCSSETCQAMQSHPPVSLATNNYNSTSFTPMAGHNTSAIGGNHSSTFSFHEVLQPPGTPDDDDYRHNYQDIPPLGRYEPSASNVTSSQRCSQPTTSGGMLYNSMQMDNLKDLRNLHHNQTPQSSSDLMNLANSVDQPPLPEPPPNHSHLNMNNQVHSGNSNATQASATAGNQFNLHHMAAHNMESCASPFQSPAPTPYPSMTSYLNPEMPDYYSDSDCLRYANS